MCSTRSPTSCDEAIAVPDLPGLLETAAAGARVRHRGRAAARHAVRFLTASVTDRAEGRD